MNRSTLGILASGLVAAVALVACGSGSHEPGSNSAAVKVGVLPDLSGPLAFQGKPELAGLQAYIKEFNSKGGANGRNIELVVRDIRSDVQSGPPLYRQLVQQGVLIVVGPDLSTVWAGVARLAAKEHVAQVSAGGIDSLVRPPQAFLYLGTLHPFDAARIQTNFIAKLKARDAIAKPKVAIISVRTASSDDWRKAVALDVQNVLGGEVVSEQQVDPTATSVDAQTAAVARAAPDYVVTRLLSAQVPLTVHALRDRGFQGSIIDDFSSSDEAVFQAVQDPKFYAIREFVDPSETSIAAVVTMRQAATAAGTGNGMGNAWFTYGYVLGKVIADAIVRCGNPCDGSKLNQALEGSGDIQTNGLNGPIGFSATDHELAKYGRPYVWDQKSGHAVPAEDWISGRGT